MKAERINGFNPLISFGFYFVHISKGDNHYQDNKVHIDLFFKSQFLFIKGNEY